MSDSDDLGGPVDLRHPGAGMERDAVLLVPVERIDEDLARALGAAQDVRQQNAIVVAVGLVAEHGDVELVRPAAGEQSPRRRVPRPCRSRRRRASSSSPLFLASSVRCRAQISKRPMSSTRWPVAPSGRGEQHLELGFGEEVLDDGERHMLAALGADREVAHRFAVAHQREIDQLARWCCRRADR